MKWYEKRPALFELEKKLMKRSYPNAVLHELEDGRIGWMLSYNVPTEGNQVRTWKIMLVYDYDHPLTARNYFGGSVRCYFISPTSDKLRKEAASYGYAYVPHILSDGSDTEYMCNFRMNDVGDGRKQITTAVASAIMAYKWSAWYESGLRNSAIWAKFCEH